MELAGDIRVIFAFYSLGVKDRIKFRFEWVASPVEQRIPRPLP